MKYKYTTLQIGDLVRVDGGDLGRIVEIPTDDDGYILIVVKFADGETVPVRPERLRFVPSASRKV